MSDYFIKTSEEARTSFFFRDYYLISLLLWSGQMCLFISKCGYIPIVVVRTKFHGCFWCSSFGGVSSIFAHLFSGWYIFICSTNQQKHQDTNISHLGCMPPLTSFLIPFGPGFYSYALNPCLKHRSICTQRKKIDAFIEAFVILCQEAI